MKHIFSLLLISSISTLLLAQTVAVDKDKLFDFYQTQRYAEAAAYLQSVYPADLQDVKVMNQIAYCFMMAGKLPEAEQHYLKIIQQEATSLPVLFNLASINLRRGNHLRARNYLEEIVKSDSNNVSAYKQLAALFPDDTVSQRVNYLAKANHLNPIEPDIAFELADAYRKLKKYEPAYEVLTTAIAADTGNLILQRARLPVAIQLKRYKEVILTGEKLLNDGLDPAVIRDVAMAFFHLKKYTDAIRYFQQLESIASQSESSLYYTSLSYRHLNNYKASAEYAKRTIEESISPNVSSYYLLLGGIYESSEQFLTAIGAYKKGLTFSPNASIYYRLGLIYDLKLNQKKTAISFYRQYLNSKLDKAAEKEQIDYVKSRLESLQPPKK